MKGVGHQLQLLILNIPLDPASYPKSLCVAVQATAGAHCQDPGQTKEGAARGLQKRALQWHVVHLRLRRGTAGSIYLYTTTTVILRGNMTRPHSRTGGRSNDGRKVFPS